MKEKLAVWLQYLLPKIALTQFMGFLARKKSGAMLHSVVRWFINRYGVNMSEAADPRIESYACFNDFFTRALREGVRPLADAPWICPVDGAISQFGNITGDQIFQAKGHSYSTRALVGGDPQLTAQFENGQFACLYLSPKDYHRIHMPCDGRLTQMIYVPGDLFSVNPVTARGVPGLFARNERVVCVFENERGSFVMVLVGATVVGSMATVWHGVVNPPRPGVIVHKRYGPGLDGPAVELKRGDEMGRFLLGSTVVMLFPGQDMYWNKQWQPAGAIRMGEPMAEEVAS